MSVIAQITQPSIAATEITDLVKNKANRNQNDEVDLLLNQIKSRKLDDHNSLSVRAEELKTNRQNKKDTYESIANGVTYGLGASAVFGKGTMSTLLTIGAAAIHGYSKGGWTDAINGGIAAGVAKYFADNSELSGMVKGLLAAGLKGGSMLAEDFVLDKFGSSRSAINSLQNTSSELDKLSILKELQAKNGGQDLREIAQQALSRTGTLNSNDFNGMIANQLLQNNAEKALNNAEPELNKSMKLG